MTFILVQGLHQWPVAFDLLQAERKKKTNRKKLVVTLPRMGKGKECMSLVSIRYLKSTGLCNTSQMQQRLNYWVPAKFKRIPSIWRSWSKMQQVLYLSFYFK